MNRVARALLGATIVMAGMYATGCAQVQPNTFGRAEYFSGNQSSTLDVKAGTSITKNTGVFFRNRTTVTKENEVNNFTLADLTYSLGGGVSAVVEGQAIPGVGAIPRVGAQYSGSWGNFNLFGIGVVRPENHGDLELALLPSYNRKLSEKLNLGFEVEGVTSIGEQGHQWSALRPRAYLNFGNLKVGPAVDLSFDKKGKVTEQYGAVLRVDF